MGIEEGIDMESRIIEAAKLMFVKRGYESTKMGDIAAEVGISRTAMHYYFRTKEMLFEAIFSQLMGVLLPNIDAVMHENTGILEKLPKIITLYMSTLHVNPLFPIFVINELHRDPEHLYQAVLKDPARVVPIMRLRRQMEEEMSSGSLKKIPILYVVSTLMGLLIFPLLARNPLTAVFLDGDDEKFEAFLEERKPFIIEMMTQLLDPGKQK